MKSKDWLAFILLGTIWGSSFLWIKIAVQEVGPILLVAIRLLFGILALLVVVAFTRPKLPRGRQIWINLTILGLINNALPYTLISWGEQFIDSAVAAILNSTTPLFTMLVAHLFLTDDRMTRRRVFSLVMGFLGILLLFSRDLGYAPRGNILGQAAVLAASVAYAFASVFARRTTQGLSPSIQALVPLLGADLLMWMMVPLAESPLALPSLPITWFALVWLGVMGVAIAFLLFFYLLHSVGPTRTVLVTYVFPLVGVALGVIFLGENLDWQLVGGAVLVIASVIVLNRGR